MTEEMPPRQMQGTPSQRFYFSVFEEITKTLDLLQSSNPTIFRNLGELVDKEWINFVKERMELTNEKNILSILEAYAVFLHENNIISKEEMRFEKKEGVYIIHLKGDQPFYIRRGAFFSKIVELVTEQHFDIEAIPTKTGYAIGLTPSTFKPQVVISHRIRKGIIKVSSKDMKKLGVDLIEDVILTPEGGTTGIAEMLFSEDRIIQGFVYVSVSDARLLNISEGERVSIEKRRLQKPSAREEKRWESDQPEHEEETPEEQNEEIEEPVEQDEKEQETLVEEPVEKTSEPEEVIAPPEEEENPLIEARELEAVTSENKSEKTVESKKEKPKKLSEEGKALEERIEQLRKAKE